MCLYSFVSNLSIAKAVGSVINQRQVPRSVRETVESAPESAFGNWADCGVVQSSRTDFSGIFMKSMVTIGCRRVPPSYRRATKTPEMDELARCLSKKSKIIEIR